MLNGTQIMMFTTILFGDITIWPICNCHWCQE